MHRGTALAAVVFTGGTALDTIDMFFFVRSTIDILVMNTIDILVRIIVDILVINTAPSTF